MNYVLDEDIKVDVEAEEKWGGCSLKRRMNLGIEMLSCAQATFKKMKQ